MYVDTHLHLDEPWLVDNNKRQKVIADITENKIVTWAQACDIPGYLKIVEWAKQSDYIFPSFGVLPWYADEYQNRHDEVRKLSEEAIMLGEIGLDTRAKRYEKSFTYQEEFFDIFLEIAERNNMIMNCHFRGTEARAFEILCSYKVPKTIYHWYSGSVKLMDKINDAGYFYSIGQVNLDRTSEKSKERLAERFQKIPDELLLLEIDVLRKEKSEIPSAVFPRILKDVAELRNTSPEEIEDLNHQNVLRLIGNDPKLKQMRDLLTKD